MQVRKKDLATGVNQARTQCSPLLGRRDLVPAKHNRDAAGSQRAPDPAMMSGGCCAQVVHFDLHHVDDSAGITVSCFPSRERRLRSTRGSSSGSGRIRSVGFEQLFRNERPHVERVRRWAGCHGGATTRLKKETSPEGGGDGVDLALIGQVRQWFSAHSTLSQSQIPSTQFSHLFLHRRG